MVSTSLAHSSAQEWHFLTRINNWHQKRKCLKWVFPYSTKCKKKSLPFTFFIFNLAFHHVSLCAVYSLMLQVLLLGFNNLDLNKFILLQREDKNGCTWHKTKASVYFTRSFIFLHLFSIHFAWDGGLQARWCTLASFRFAVDSGHHMLANTSTVEGGGQCVCKCLYVSVSLVGGCEWMVGVCMCAYVCARAFWCGCWPQPLPGSTARCFRSAGTLTLWPCAPAASPLLLLGWVCEMCGLKSSTRNQK